MTDGLRLTADDRAAAMNAAFAARPGGRLALQPGTVERMGETVMPAHGRLRGLAGAFGLAEDDLSLDLGPLGRLS